MHTNAILAALYYVVEVICFMMLIAGLMIFAVLCLLQIFKKKLYLQSRCINRLYAWIGRLCI